MGNIVFLLLFSCAVFAQTTYYVNVALGSDGNAGTSAGASAWETIQKAANTVVAGDSVFVEDGDYTSQGETTESTSGSSGNLIVYQAESASVLTAGFNLTGSYIRIRGFDITTNRLDVDGDFCEVLDCNIHNMDTGSPSNVGIDLGSNSNDCIIQGNTISYAIRCGIFINGDDHLIENNDISHTLHRSSDADGIRFFGSGHLVRGNYLHDIYWGAPDNSGDPHVDFFQTWDDATNIIFEKNLCVSPNTTGSNQITMIEDGTSFGPNPVSNLTFRNNIFVMRDPGYCPARFGKTTGSNTLSGIKFYNNTFVFLGASPYGESAFWSENTTGIEIKNNIIYNFGNASVNYIRLIGTNTSFSASNNLVYKTNGIGPAGPMYTNDVWNDNPDFVNISNLDFHLLTGSPAIDAGVDLSAEGFTDDYADSTRGATWDIGAFEFGGTAPPPPPPPEAADGTRWYVHATLSTGANNGTNWADAWQGVGSIDWGDLTGGDTLEFSGGDAGDSLVYTSTVVVQADSILVRKGEDTNHNGTPVIHPSTPGDAFTISGFGQITIDGFRCLATGQIDIDNAYDIEVKNCTIHISTTGGVDAQDAVWVRIHDNTFTSPDGTDTYAVETTRTDSVWIYENFIQLTGNSDAYPCIDMNNDTLAYIYNNFISNIGSNTGHIGIYQNASNGVHVFYNNIIYMPNASAGKAFWLRHASAGPDTIYNNTFYGGIQVVDFDFINTTTGAVFVKNNIIASEETDAIGFDFTGTVTGANIDYNLYHLPNSSIFARDDGTNRTWAEWQSDGAEANGDTANTSITLGVTDPSSLNFSLTSVSKAVEAGVDLGSFYELDKDGITRPVNTNWDMGALEFFGSIDRTIWYVDNSAGGANNGHSWTDAWESIGDVNMDTLTAGDTLIFSGGVSSKSYTGDISVTNSPDSVTIMGAEEAGHNGTVIINTDGWSFESVEGYIIKNLSIFSSSVAAENGAIFFSGINQTVEGCVINADTLVGLQLDNSSGVIRNNTIYVSYAFDIIFADAFSDTLLVESNILSYTRHPTLVSSQRGLAGLAEEGAVILINKNIIADITETDTDQGGSIVSLINIKGRAIFANNSLLSDSSKVAITGGGAADSAVIYNNTIINSAVNLSISGIEYVQAKNNIFHSTDNVAHIIIDNLTGKIFNYNLYYSEGDPSNFVVNSVNKTWLEWKGLGQEVNGLNASPFFDDEDAGRAWSVSDTSWAIDNGVDLGSAYASDLEGTVRPQLTAWDIGAQEKTTGEMQVVTPEGAIIRQKYGSYNKYKGW